MRARPSALFSATRFSHQTSHLAIVTRLHDAPGLNSTVYTVNSGKEYIADHPEIASFSDLLRVLKTQGLISKAILTVHYAHLVPASLHSLKRLKQVANFERDVTIFQNTDMADLFNAAHAVVTARRPYIDAEVAKPGVRHQ